jgi:hypothetical protein
MLQSVNYLEKMRELREREHPPAGRCGWREREAAIRRTKDDNPHRMIVTLVFRQAIIKRRVEAAGTPG